MRVSSLADVGVDPLVIPHTVAELAPPEPSYKNTRAISNNLSSFRIFMISRTPGRYLESSHTGMIARRQLVRDLFGNKNHIHPGLHL
jgi:hypothetical protein